MICLEHTMQQIGLGIYSRAGTTAGRGSTARAENVRTMLTIVLR